ncbi:hypothetical protein [Rhodopila sp.]|uniref:hypothetical protein n=1 Tax=Rhodopila sp. TaxID=2480087 RepID=UPI003D0CFC38
MNETTGSAAKGRGGSIPLALGETASKVEDTSVALGTNWIYRIRMRHPLLYGLGAFIIGSGLLAIFTMTTYKNWSFEGVNLKTAVYQVFWGGLCGGIVATALAFAYTSLIRPTLAPLKSAGVIGSEESTGAPPRQSR